MLLPLTQARAARCFCLGQCKEAALCRLMCAVYSSAVACVPDVQTGRSWSGKPGHVCGEIGSCARSTCVPPPGARSGERSFIRPVLLWACGRCAGRDVAQRLPSAGWSDEPESRWQNSKETRSSWSNRYSSVSVNPFQFSSLLFWKGGRSILQCPCSCYLLVMRQASVGDALGPSAYLRTCFLGSVGDPPICPSRPWPTTNLHFSEWESQPFFPC